MQKEKPIVLSIAGFDPSGGAGILADIKTLESLQVQSLAIITADTLQTEKVCYEVIWRSAEDIEKGIGVLMNHYSIDVAKIGIVPNVKILQTILYTLRQQAQHIRIVWDPVIRSSSGTSFFNEQDLPKLVKLMKYIELITPNYPEYELLKPYISPYGGLSILIKGGHRSDNKGTDILLQNDREIRLLPSSDVQEIFPKHGSGCVLSSAIAAHLANGQSLEEACRLGKKYVENFLKSSPTLTGYHHNER
ncbi:hydroxymethylpyrimidine/phosphomethylpyrimidine kinase [Sphingobacterium wenxiniae]|uniref:hydroxymethylpyrimidine kinase n=1 Tax=Sphingobacterium wenxiniae TaxID=683125 RepID=A0A1I6Q0E7_9SPHI|nr:hydroxymethylpyrimidine/phosphomethylpyrimidine kinase [Sphingobacterium wenxiniae]SFS45894.1 hydroxymethylpyrimidine/phosphomethylpyrimidine kinase [Sphingobacterium wenxiniae]